MAKLGNNIYICKGSSTTAIAGTRANEIQVDAETIEVANPLNGLWKKFINGRKEWSVNTSFLVGSNISSDISSVGGSYTLYFVQRSGSSVSTICYGTAILTSYKIDSQIANLVKGTFTFKGSGTLSTI